MAIATANKRFERADGGPAPTSLGEAADPVHPSLPLHSGFIVSDTPGRTDRLPRTVPADSFVIPASEVAIIGQGNSVAGAKLLDDLFGLQSTGGPGGLASGGNARRSEVIVAGGEYIVPPEVVRRYGDGSVSKGQALLRGMVKKLRAYEIERLKHAPSPKR